MKISFFFLFISCFYSMMKYLLYVIMLAELVSCHISLVNPCPRYSPVAKNCPALPEGEKMDTSPWAINAPISSITLKEHHDLCRHKKPFPKPAATWKAGQEITVEFNPHRVTHSGGHCEFSISYDNGKTFAVIHQELKYCFYSKPPTTINNDGDVLKYTFKLPKDLPESNKAVFAWTWVNASGNREFYMNCVDVAITGGGKNKYKGKKMTIANYPNYPTIPEFHLNYDTGLDIYKKAGQVEVGPEGSGPAADSSGGDDTSGNGNDSPGNYTSDSGNNPPSGNSSSGNTGNTGYPGKNVNYYDHNNGGGCQSGTMKCSSSNGFQICDHGSWGFSRTCATGTGCKPYGLYIICDYLP